MRPWEVPYAQRFKGRKPRICIGWVAYGDISPECFESTAFWMAQNGKRYGNKFEIHTAIATKREQYRARNSLCASAQAMEADFILMLDDDHTPHDCPTMLMDFFAEEKPFQGGLYVQRRDDKLVPVIQKYDPKTGDCFWCSMEEVPGAEGGPVDILGGGVNWIDVSVLDFLTEPLWWPHALKEQNVNFHPNLRFGLDMYFSLEIKRRLRIQPWLNGKVRIGHIVSERQVIRPPGANTTMLCPGCDQIAQWDEYSARYVCNNCGGL